MMSPQIGSYENGGARLTTDVTRPRARNEETAQRITLVAIRQWERAITGVLAVPAAAALSTASAVMFVTAIVERAFHMAEGTLAEIGRRVGDDFDAHGEPRRERANSDAS